MAKHRIVTRIPPETPLRDISQSLQAVLQQFIQDQQATDRRNVVRSYKALLPEATL